MSTRKIINCVSFLFELTISQLKTLIFNLTEEVLSHILTIEEPIRDKLVDRLRAKTLVVEHYLTKPSEPQELLNIVKQLTEKESGKLSEASSEKSPQFNY